ncbi:hypothetical protein GNT65_01155 [Shewanella sp. JBTF-M18]|uniref:Uncharacterized protein n=1 Tax=Shewanella insulae TaxID=2681496 RepID=A0A6L7HUK0_9GAMM|nr:hypothetical protein [Shewanella insulae]MXR67294.1 hypothetical protein [Shewanella insulae]
MKRILCLLIMSVMLVACDAANGLKDMLNKQQKAQNLVKEKYGWDAQVGFEIYNGDLSQVTLVFSADDVRDQSVAHLESIAREVVSATFESAPQAMYIQIASTADNKS